MKKRLVGLTLALALLALAPAAQAGPVSGWNVTVNTSGLGSGSILDFQLIDNNGNADGNNWATITSLSLGGGSLDGSPTATGGATGSLTGMLTLTDSGDGGANDFNQMFDPGTSLFFLLRLSTNVSPDEMAGFPDSFFFTIYDSNTMTQTVLEFDIAGDKLTPIFNAPGSDGSVVITAVPAPEPGTLSLFAGMLALGGVGYVWRRRRNGSEPPG